jgi:hypothetical protein
MSPKLFNIFTSLLIFFTSLGNFLTVLFYFFTYIGIEPTVAFIILSNFSGLLKDQFTYVCD